MSECAKKFNSHEFIWKITNFSQQKLTKEPITVSQVFPAECERDLNFTINLFIVIYSQKCVLSAHNEVSNEEKWTSVNLLTKSSKEYDNSHFELSVLDANGEKFGIRRLHKKIPSLVCFRDFIRQTDLENPANNLLPNNTLTICCRVKGTKSKTEGECNCQIEPQTKRARLQLVHDLASLLDDKSADFIFKVENEKIPAHRAILKARSPVFAAMFQHDMKENRTNETEINDVTHAAFKALLRFIYTGHCQVENFAQELLIAANKYDIRDLKQICAEELCRKLTAGNVVRLLILSDLHKVNVLKEGAIRFINKNAPAVMKTTSWYNFTKTHQHLITELDCKLFD